MTTAAWIIVSLTALGSIPVLALAIVSAKAVRVIEMLPVRMMAAYSGTGREASEETYLAFRCLASSLIRTLLIASTSDLSLSIRASRTEMSERSVELPSGPATIELLRAFAWVMLAQYVRRPWRVRMLLSSVALFLFLEFGIEVTRQPDLSKVVDEMAQMGTC